MSNIEKEIEKQRKEAREVCGNEGTESQDCAVAWDTVEELQSEYAHQRSEQPKKTSFEKYCEDNPEAAECRVYDD